MVLADAAAASQSRQIYEPVQSQGARTLPFLIGSLTFSAFWKLWKECQVGYGRHVEKLQEYAGF